MGLGDKLKSATSGGSGVSSSTGHYEAEVNKGSLNVGGLTARLNARWESGWALDKIFEQDGNTVMIWARRG